MEFTDFKKWVDQSKEIMLSLKGSRTDSYLLEKNLLKYVQFRFFLEDIPSIDDSIYSLAEKSVANMAKISPEQLYKMEQIGGCTGAKSGMVKKVLLLMSLKEYLDLDVSEDELTAVDTLKDILDIINMQFSHNKIYIL